jgi:TMEM175 potassium channel family protein
MLGTFWLAVHTVLRLCQDSDRALALVGRRLVLAQGLYAASAAVALLSPEAAIGALALVQLFFVVSPRLPWRV